MQFLSIRFMLIAFLLHAATAFSAPKYPTATSIYPWCDDDYRAVNKTGSGLRGGDYHFCGGLDGLYNIYKVQRPELRRNGLENVIGEFNYMISQNPGSTHPFLAEVHVYRATALRMAGRSNEASVSYLKAIEINPRLLRAYHEYIGFLVVNKQKDLALQYATQALRYLPGSPSLQQRYTELGGQLPYPEPIEKPNVGEVPRIPVATSQAGDKPVTTVAPSTTSGSGQPASKPPAETAPRIGD